MPRDHELDRLRTEMNGAWDAMKYAEQQMNDAWEELQRLQDRYGPQIDSLKAEHQRLYDRTQDLSRDIDSAFNYGNRDEGFRLIEEVKEVRAEMADLPPQWRSMIDEINPARERWSYARDIYKDKKHEHRLAKERFDDRKAELEGARRDSAIRAGVPAHYGDEVKVVNEPGGNTSVYFGGVGKPDGPGHAHYVVDQFGNLTWRREPFEDRGPHNAR